MKRYLKLFLVFLCVILSLAGNTCCANYVLQQNGTPVIQNTEQAQSVLLNFYVLNDTSIAASNNNGYEISALKSDTENDFGIFENAGSGNVFCREYLKRYYLKIISYVNKNVLSVIKNEICVRAP
jgi:hypothetical protein